MLFLIFQYVLDKADSTFHKVYQKFTLTVETKLIGETKLIFWSKGKTAIRIRSVARQKKIILFYS